MTKNITGLKKLDKAKNTGGSTPPVTTKKNTIFDLILSKREDIESSLPATISTDKFIRLALTEFRINETLQKCSKASIFGGLYQLAQLGLELGQLGHAYLIPYWNKNKGTFEAQLQVGYKGLIELTRRTGEIKNITANEVYKNDEIKVQYGTNQSFDHIPNLFDKGEIIGYYAHVQLINGGESFEFMTKLEIEEHMKQWAKGLDKWSSPWKTSFNEMAKKTVLKKVLKYMPLSTDIRNILASDETIKEADVNGEVPKMDEVTGSLAIEGDTEIMISEEECKNLFKIFVDKKINYRPILKEKYKRSQVEQLTQNQYLEWSEELGA